MKENIIKGNKTKEFERELKALLSEEQYAQFSKIVVKNNIFIVDDEYLNTWKTSLDKIKAERDQFLEASLYSYQLLAPFITKFEQLTDKEIAKSKTSATFLGKMFKLEKEMMPNLQKVLALKGYFFKQLQDKQKLLFIKDELWPKLKSTYKLIESYK